MRLYFICEETGRIRAINQMLKIEDPNRKQKVVEAILQADPDSGKRFSLWLTTLVNRGFVGVSGVLAASPTTQVRLPEDNPRIQKVLLAFQKALKKLPPDQRDITKFKDFYSVEEAVDKLVQAGAVVAATSARKVPGAEIVYQTPPYVVYKVKKIINNGRPGWDPVTRQNIPAQPITPEEQQRIKAIEFLGMGPPETKWCTRAGYGQQSMASHYLSSQDMFVIYKDGRPFIQICGKQIMDVNDRRTQIPDEIMEVIRPAKKKSGGTGEFPPGLKLENASLTTTEGNTIPCLHVVDAGTFYYFTLGPIVQSESHRVSKAERVLEKAGVGIHAQLSAWAKSPEVKAARQEAKNLRLVMRELQNKLRAQGAEGMWRDPEYIEVMDQLNAAEDIADGGKGYNRQAQWIVTRPQKILTVNKVNVANIVDSTGKSYRLNPMVALPGAAQPGGPAMLPPGPG